MNRPWKIPFRWKINYSIFSIRIWIINDLPYNYELRIFRFSLFSVVFYAIIIRIKCVGLATWYHKMYMLCRTYIWNIKLWALINILVECLHKMFRDINHHPVDVYRLLCNRKLAHHIDYNNNKTNLVDWIDKILRDFFFSFTTTQFIF